jgi:hypothetical protein
MLENIFKKNSEGRPKIRNTESNPFHNVSQELPSIITPTYIKDPKVSSIFHEFNVNSPKDYIVMIFI